MARPIPRLDPVMTATWPLRSNKLKSDLEDIMLHRFRVDGSPG